MSCVSLMMFVLLRLSSDSNNKSKSETAIGKRLAERKEERTRAEEEDTEDATLRNCLIKFAQTPNDLPVHTHSLTRLLSHSLTRLLSHLLTHSLIHSVAHSLIHSLTLSYIQKPAPQ